MGSGDITTKKAEQATTRDEMSMVYKITKQLCCSNIKQSTPVNDTNGTAVTTEQGQADRWVEHFCQVLNQPQPDNPADPAPAVETLNIDPSPPTQEEVHKAIRYRLPLIVLSTHAGPPLWNSIPNSLRAAETIEGFKRELKPYLFSL